MTVASLMSLAELSSEPATSQPGPEPFPVILWGSGVSHHGLGIITVGSSGLEGSWLNVYPHSAPLQELQLLKGVY